MEERGWDGKVALVTGGGGGIGRAVALALSARGVRIVVTGRSERALGETVGEIAYGGGKARHLAGDVRDPAHLASAIGRAHDTFGGLHFVIANAAQASRIPIGEGELEAAKGILETNLIGTYMAFHFALREMKGPGRLVATSSVLAEQGHAGYAAYCASKAAILGLVRAVAEEVRPRQITCNAVMPGWAEPGAREELAPEEVAERVVFLCSEDASGITGQALRLGDRAAS